MFLITGGAGMIGSNVVSLLNTKGISDILIVDDLMDGRKSLNLVGRDFADYMDWRELAAGQNKLPQLDGIIHLGAISDTLFTNGKVLMEQNYAFSKRMLSLAEEHQCSFIYASSASVYGDVNKCAESFVYESPKSPYAVSKWVFDQFVRRKIASRDGEPGLRIPVIGLRYFNVYGPGEEHKGNMASFVYKCFTAIKNHEPITLFFGSGDIYRDFIYVDDAARLTVEMLNKNVSGIFNVGTGVATSFLALAEIIRENTLTPDIQTIPIPDVIYPGYQWYTKADLSTLKQLFSGRAPEFTSVRDGVNKYRAAFNWEGC